jgi:hypothetical protein
VKTSFVLALLLLTAASPAAEAIGGCVAGSVSDGRRLRRLRGRMLSAQDVADGRKVAVVNETLASRTP